MMNLSSTPAHLPSLSSLFEPSRPPPPCTVSASYGTLPVPPSPSTRSVSLTPHASATVLSVPAPSSSSPASFPSFTPREVAQRHAWPQPPMVKVEAPKQQQQRWHGVAAEWNKENQQRPLQPALNGHNGITQHPPQSDQPPLQPSLLPQPPSASPSPPPLQQPFTAALPSVLQTERPYAYFYTRPSLPLAPVVPFLPPSTVDVPHSINLSFRAVRPTAAVRPAPALSKAAQRRQAAKETAKAAAADSQSDNATPTKRKRAEQQQQPSTPESDREKKRSDKGKEAAEHSNKQASLYSFFSSPHRQAETAKQRNEANEDDGEEEYGRSEEKTRSKESTGRKRKKTQTLEQVEKEVRKLVFSTTDTSPPQAASKASRKKADKADGVEGNNEERADDDDFVEAISKQSCLGLYSSQSDYNRNVLDALRQQYQDISQPLSAQHPHPQPTHTRCFSLCPSPPSVCTSATSHDALQLFWDQAHSRYAVSIAAIFYNGSTSYRWPSEQQKKRFRLFNRIGRHHERRDAKTIDTVDIREHGVIKCTALTFTFALRESELASQLHDSEQLKFMMTVWHDKSEEEASDEQRAQLCAVVQGVMALPIEKVAFDAKEVLCVLMSSLRWAQAPHCQQLVDVQVACWLLDPNVSKQSERDKYQLLPLVKLHLDRHSDYHTEVTDRPADIMRGLLVDMADVVLVWHYVRGQLALQRMNAVFHEQEMRLLPVLAEMQYLGTRFDGDSFKRASNAIIAKMTAMVRHGSVQCM